MKLLVYIPTFRRTALLAKQLAAITSAVAKVSGEVRVIVSNNDPDDPLIGVLRAQYALQEFVSFRERIGNIGANANISLGFIEVEVDEYLWILSDDDIITDEAVGLIADTINKEAPDLVQIVTSGGRDVKAVRRDQVLDQPGYGFSLISALVYKASYIAKSIGCAFDYMESSFPHLAVILDSTSINGAARVATLPASVVFTGEGGLSDADYSISHAGFGYLADFSADIPKFVETWLLRTWLDYFIARSRATSSLAHARFARSWGYISQCGPRVWILLRILHVVFLVRAGLIFVLRLTGMVKRRIL